MTPPTPDSLAPHFFEVAHGVRDIAAAEAFPESRNCTTPRARAEN